LRPGDIVVWNKADLGKAPELTQTEITELAVSAKTGAGMAALVAALTEKAGGGAFADGPALTRLRHVHAVEEALAALARAQDLLARLPDSAPELAAEDARLAARALGKITGAVGVEDVLGEIFSSFCIGK
jgi:tRNA modification GTPase